MITNYIPNTCKYSVNNLKKVVHIFSESENVIHIDNGQAYVSSGITDFQTIYATSVDFAESTSYDDRFKFEKQITVTVDGFLKLDSLNEKYYLVLEDENHTMWLVNADFPSFVTYTYTLADGTDETVFTFNVLSNFPTLKLNAKINNSYECKDYSLANVKELKMNLKENCTIDHVNHIIYDSSNTPYYIVKFNENSLKVEETYDGFNVTTTIQFNINFDDYKASWHYNLLEYQDNKYVAVTDHLAAGFEMGLIPSYNVQGSSQKGQGDIVTIRLVGTSQRGSEWAETWTEATLMPEYVWLLSNEWICDGDIPPVPPTGEIKWIAYYSDSHTESAECDSTSAITSVEINKTNLVSVEIGDCVTEIGDWAFYECYSLTAVTLPNTVTSINLKAFRECGFTNIVLPNNLVTIGEESFLACSLTGITIPNSVTTIGSKAFSTCRSLTSIVIPTGVTSINEYTFSSCDSLTSVIIPDSVTSIGQYAFTYCQSLTNIIIPSGVTSIGKEAFSYCIVLSTVTILATTPPTLADRFVFSVSPVSAFYVPCASVDVYKAASGWSAYADRIQGIPPCGQPTFDGKFKLTLSDSSTVSAECDSSSSAISRSEISAYSASVTSAVIGDCVTSISMNTFSGCRSLTSCTIGTGVTSIGDQAFDYCTSLASINIPDSVTYIGWLTFHGCVSLTSVTIPSGVTAINYGAFLNCSGLTSITCLGTTPPMLDERVFDNTNNCPIYVPSVSVNTYKSAYGWGGYVDRIQGMP